MVGGWAACSHVLEQALELREVFLWPSSKCTGVTGLNPGHFTHIVFSVYFPWTSSQVPGCGYQDAKEKLSP